MKKLAFLVLFVTSFIYAQEPNTDMDSVITGKVSYYTKDVEYMARGLLTVNDR